jgi:hypothetical protein
MPKTDKTVACKFCGKTGLVWSRAGSKRNQWRLIEFSSEFVYGPHLCKAYRTAREKKKLLQKRKIGEAKYIANRNKRRVLSGETFRSRKPSTYRRGNR